MTKIERLQNIGIRRLGSPQRGFRYRSATGGRVSKADLERIDSLKIPPAWKEVAINPAANGRVQVIGKDAAGRWQYLYHSSHTRLQEAKKFRRLTKFAKTLPAMRKTVSRHLKQNDLGRERVLACILRILSTCFLRPGSQVYASENGSYGIATLRRKHVRVKGNTVEFDFPGKSGVQQQRKFEDRQVAKVIRALLKEPGYNVFKYRNGGGELTKVSGRQINAYIKEVMGEKFSAKDFRTWAGTLVCASILAREGLDEDEDKRTIKKKIVAAVKETSEALGNTPAVCRSSYVSPEILHAFEQGEVIDSYFNDLGDLTSFRGRSFHKSERALLKFLKRSVAK
jgi:DNA topoisomerase-1